MSVGRSKNNRVVPVDNQGRPAEKKGYEKYLLTGQERARLLSSLLPVGGEAVACLVDNFFRKLEASFRNSASIVELKRWHEWSAALMEDVAGDDDIQASCSAELDQLGCVLVKADKKMNQLDTQWHIVESANRADESNQTKLEQLLADMKDVLLKLAMKMALTGRSPLPRGLSEPLRRFWVDNIGWRQVPWDRFLAIVRACLGSAVMSDLRQTIVSAQPQLAEGIGTCIDPVELVLRAGLDPDGCGMVAAVDLHSMMLRCRQWAGPGADPELGLEQCVRLMAHHIAAELLLPTEEELLQKLRSWLQLPAAQTTQLREVQAQFLDGTRRWVLEEVKYWRELPRGGRGVARSRHRALLLCGGPGMGKSTLAAVLVQRRLVDAHHFFQHDDARQADPLLMLRSLALQLASRVPSVRRALQRHQAAGTPPTFKDLDDAFDQLLRMPLLAAEAEARDGDLVLLLDALDEAALPLDENQPSLLLLLCKRLKELPEWVRLIMTSRPEDYILHALGVGAGFTVLTLSPDDSRNLADVHNLIEENLRQLRPPVEGPLHEQALAEVEFKSDGSLLYAAKLFDELTMGRSHGQQHAAFTLEDFHAFPRGLAGIYAHWFETHIKPSEMDLKEYADIKRLLEVMVVARERPVGLLLLQEWLQLGRLELRNVLLPRLGTLVQRAGTVPEAFQLHHKSFSDWLLRPAAGETLDFGVSAAAGHVIIAECVEREWKRNQAAALEPTSVASSSRASTPRPATAEETVASAVLCGSLRGGENCAARTAGVLPGSAWFAASTALPRATAATVPIPATSHLSRYSLAHGLAHLAEAALAPDLPQAQRVRWAEMLCELAGNEEGFWKEVEAAGVLPEALREPDLYRRALLASSSYGVAVGLYHVGRKLYGGGRYRDAIPLQRHALESATQAKGQGHPDTLHCVEELATSLWQQGQHGEAEALYSRALEGLTAALGPGHPDTLWSITNLAACLQEQGRNSDAEPLHRHALEGMTAVLGPEDPVTLAAVNNLANCLKRQGRCGEAEPLHRRALEGRTAALGPDHSDTLASVNNLAGCLQVQGRYGEAEPLFRCELEGKKAALGPGHPDTLSSVSNLALCLQVQGRYGEAESLYRNAREGRTAALGPEHPDTLTSVSNLAGCLQVQGRYGEAAPLFRRALEGKMATLGPVHSDTLWSKSNLAVCLFSQGRYGEAEPLIHRALEGQTAALGPEHLDALSSTHCLAVCLTGQGRHGEAEPLHRRVMAGLAAALGPEHPNTFGSVDNLACCLTAQGRHGEAEPLHRRALEGLTVALGPEHPDTAEALTDLGDCLDGQGRHAEAEPLHRHALGLKERLLGPQHPHNAHALHGLATALDGLGRHAEAEPLFRRALALHTATLGSQDLATARSAHGLAGCLVAQGRPGEAEALYCKALAVRSALLGPLHADTVALERGLMECLAIHSSA